MAPARRVGGTREDPKLSGSERQLPHPLAVSRKPETLTPTRQAVCKRGLRLGWRLLCGSDGVCSGLALL